MRGRISPINTEKIGRVPCRPPIMGMENRSGGVLELFRTRPGKPNGTVPSPYLVQNGFGMDPERF